MQPSPHLKLGLHTILTHCPIWWDQTTASEIKKFQGNWICIVAEENGIKLDKETVIQQNRRLEIKGNSLKMSRVIGKNQGSYEGKFEVDPSGNNFDWVGKRPGGAYVEWIGMYELGDDFLKLRYTYNSTKRPTTFKTSKPTKPGFAEVYYLYKRDNN